MKLIDADVFKTHLEHEAWSRGHVELLRARDIADETPTVDAVPVIRCKDCKYWDGDSCHVDVWDSEADADMIILDRYADDYCSRAVRKDNGAD